MGRCHIIYVLSLGFVAALNTEAAISPLDKIYTASVDTDLTIPWSFDHEADMSLVVWSHTSMATTTTVMSKSGTNAPIVFNNFNIEHVNNGEVKLRSVTMDNAGIYYCLVSYSVAAGYPTVTGTATISIEAQTTTVSVTVFESDDVTFACTLTGSFTLPEWKGPPQLMKYTNQDDTSETISPQAPAAGRLQYASTKCNKKDLILSNAQISDSGDYSCSYKALGPQTVAAAIATWAHCRTGAERLESVSPSFYAQLLDADVRIRLDNGTTLLKIVNDD
ncbi:uncharacterized protein LOC132754290 [Ruditapes philippinarum]|uniref:uncharacterized protein LOC132754290 n=1 Tax=Ruditapes philippinarum TaxID=129788 RepID=UPI00295BA944|nr:uncharacterized protein LOC132754290 [Ruditapes philippinarum]